MNRYQLLRLYHSHYTSQHRPEVLFQDMCQIFFVLKRSCGTNVLHIPPQAFQNIILELVTEA